MYVNTTIAFFGPGKVLDKCINTSPAPEKHLYTYPAQGRSQLENEGVAQISTEILE